MPCQTDQGQLIMAAGHIKESYKRYVHKDMFQSPVICASSNLPFAQHD